MGYLYSGDEISIITQQVNDAFRKANKRMSEIEETLKTLTEKVERLEQQNEAKEDKAE